MKLSSIVVDVKYGGVLIVILPPKPESAYLAENVKVICERAPTWLVAASTMSSLYARARLVISLGENTASGGLPPPSVTTPPLSGQLSFFYHTEKAIEIALNGF